MVSYKIFTGTSLLRIIVMLRAILMFLLFLPSNGSAQDLKQSMIGSWNGSGFAQIRPTSKAKKISCTAVFKTTEKDWLGCTLSCRKGRGRELVNLRFSEPSTKGQIIAQLSDDDDDVLVNFSGTVTDHQITLRHPDTLEFGGVAYQPMLVFDLDDDGALRMTQVGVPVSDGDQYNMSKLNFSRRK